MPSTKGHGVFLFFFETTRKVLVKSYPMYDFWPKIGLKLWLDGDRSVSLSAKMVLDTLAEA